jgi:translation initiation factor IF-3
VRPINQNLRCNEQIRVTPVRVIDDNNEQLGIMPNNEALQMARDRGLDLVEVAPNVRPPVCRLMNYGKWKYNQKKHVKKHHELQLKEVRLRPKTDKHDLEVKLRNAIKFLRKGHKVQFTMKFRGRERFRREVALDVFKLVQDELEGKVKIDRMPSMDGRDMIMVVTALKDAFDDIEDLGDDQELETENERDLDHDDEASLEEPAGQESADEPARSAVSESASRDQESRAPSEG